MIKQTDKPIITFFAIDVSGSMRSDDYPPNRVGAACDASLEFLRESASRGGADHRAAIVTFNHEGCLALPPTDILDLRAFECVLGGLEGDGGTDFVTGLDQISAALDGRERGGFLSWLFDNPKTVTIDPTAVHHIIFLSDGHSCSKKPAKRSARALRDSGVVIETVGIGGSPADVDEGLLKAMASLDEVGKPRYRFIGDRQALLQEFKAKAARLKVC